MKIFIINAHLTYPGWSEGIASHCSILDSARPGFIIPIRFNFNFIL
jgi:hypothetical protein